MKKYLGWLLILAMGLLMISSCRSTSAPGDDSKQPENSADLTGESDSELRINGNPVSEYCIVCTDETLMAQALKLKNAIYNYCHVSLPVSAEATGEKMIILAANPAIACNRCEIEVQGDHLMMSAASVDGIGRSIPLFSQLLREVDGIFGANFRKELIFAATPIEELDGAQVTMVGETDRDAVSYRVGETAVFNCALYSGTTLVGVPYFYYELYDESTGTIESDFVDGRSGVLQVSAKPTGAGFVYLSVWVYNEDYTKMGPDDGLTTIVDEDINYCGAAGFNAEELRTAGSIPEDFDEFWDSAVEALYSEELEIVHMTDRTAAGSAYYTYSIALRCGVDIHGNPGIASGYLTFPKDAESVAMRMYFNGYGVNLPAPIYEENTAVLFMCAHSIDLDLADPSSPDYNETYWKEQQAQLANAGFDSSENTNRDTVYFKGMILRNLQGARFMVQYFGEQGLNLWDGENFECNGGSMGAFQSLTVAALDAHISKITLGVPWMCDIKGDAEGNLRKKSSFRMAFDEALMYYDSTAFAHRIQCNVEIECGLGDQLCPASGVAILYNQLKCNKRITYIQNRSHSYVPEQSGHFVREEWI